MRFVLFGDWSGHPGLAQNRELQAIIANLLAGAPVKTADILEQARAAGLVTWAGCEWRLGPAVITAPAVDGEVLTAAAAAATAVIEERIPALASAGPADGQPGPDLLIIGGVLLDLFVGQRLRDCGLVPAVPGGGRLWVLPDIHGPSVGMRCDHDSEAGIGAGVMWVGRSMSSPPLPGLPDLAAWLHGGPGPRSAVAALRLRQSGWLNGTEPSFAYLRRDGPLWQTLAGTARAVTDAAHQMVFSGLPPDPDTRLITSRLLFERVLAMLVAHGVVSLGPAIRTRLAWTGPDWRLFAEAAGKGDDGRG